MSKLTPANENPWYLRMTLFGEQGDEIDEELAEWNSRAWETLGTTNSLTDRDREWLSRKFGSRLSRFADATQWRHLSGFLWQERSGSVGPAGSIPAPDAVNFSNTRFNRAVRIPPMSHCSFRGSIFEKLVELVQSGSLDLRDVEFNGPFSGLGLGSFDVQFDGAKFKCGADFSGVEFNGNAASFKNAEFHSHTNPEAATDDAHGVGWWQGVSFNGANFKAPINMEGAKFFGAANFASAEFHDQAHFKRAEFGTTTLFSHARFHAFSDFYGARFGKGDGTTKSVCFANTTFDAPVSFEKAAFPDRLPTLTGTTLHQTTTVTARDGFWPALRGWFAKGEGEIQDHDEAKASASALRHVMSRQMLPEEEHFFFRREMHHAARLGPIGPRTPILIYETLSNFGHSIRRPIYWLGGIFGLGLGAMFAHFLGGFGIAKSAGLAAAHSFANVMPIFGFGGTYLSDTASGFPAALQVLSATQTILALPLFFFLGLGLRTRFRLR